MIKLLYSVNIKYLVEFFTTQTEQQLQIIWVIIVSHIRIIDFKYQKILQIWIINGSS